MKFVMPLMLTLYTLWATACDVPSQPNDKPQGQVEAQTLGSISELPKVEAAKGPSIVIISLDTLRQDRTAGPWGEGVMPTLRQLGEGGITFHQAWAPSSNTLVSHGSLLTGRYPWEHGFHPHKAAPKEGPDLLERLRESGYAVAAFTTHPAWLGRAHHFDRGTDTFRSEAVPGEQVVKWVSQWMAVPVDRPRALFVHLYDAHSDTHRFPYESGNMSPLATAFSGCIGELCASKMLKAVDEKRAQLPPGAKESIIEAYSLGATHVDGILKSLLQALGPMQKEAVIMVSSDHGELLGEGGWLHHGATPPVLDIPLVVAGPGVPKGLTCDRPVSLLSIYDTALCIAGVCPPSARDLREVQTLPENWPILAMNGARLGNRAAIEDTQGQVSILQRDERGSWERAEPLASDAELTQLAVSPVQSYRRWLVEALGRQGGNPNGRSLN